MTCFVYVIGYNIAIGNDEKGTIMTRKFYAAYNHYGTSTAFGDCNKPDLHVFGSKTERDSWVEQDWMHRQRITAKEFHRWEHACYDCTFAH